jgi:geranylgeranyl reductase family protein
VLLVDKATFPRDKPCGDSLTPRGVHLLREMGIDSELSAFHRVDHVRVFGAGRKLESPWPRRDDAPGHGYVVPRTALDELLLRRAEAAGAEVVEGAETVAPIFDDDRVTGIVSRTNETEMNWLAPVTIIAEGAASKAAKALGLVPRADRPLGMALRAQIQSNRPDDEFIEFYLDQLDDSGMIPGYGWVFPMGDGRINIGVGIVGPGRRFRRSSTTRLADGFIRSLPAEWNIPPAADLLRHRQLNGWTLPMGLAVWPPWKSGVMVAGDAAGVAKPFTGVGISKAIESGYIAAEVALGAIDFADPTDLSDYATRLNEVWGSYYRVGRLLIRVASEPQVLKTLVTLGMQVPPVASFVKKLAADVYKPKGGSFDDAVIRALIRLVAIGDLPGVSAVVPRSVVRFLDSVASTGDIDSQYPPRPAGFRRSPVASVSATP